MSDESAPAPQPAPLPAATAQPAPLPAFNTMAIVALVSLFVFSPLAIVFGFIARGQIKTSGERGQGLATASIVLGIISVVLGILLALAVIITIPMMKNSIEKAGHDGAIQQLQSQGVDSPN